MFFAWIRSGSVQIKNKEKYFPYDKATLSYPSCMSSPVIIQVVSEEN